LFFCSFLDQQLVEAVRHGRKREFEEFGWPGEGHDPQAEATFQASRLSWAWPEDSPRAGLRRLYQDLLKARRLWPAIRDFKQRSARLLPAGVARPECSQADRLAVGPPTPKGSAWEDPANRDQGVVLELIRGGCLHAYFNLANDPQPLVVTAPPNYKWLFSSEAGSYGGNRTDLRSLQQLSPHECVVFGPASWERLV
jgi:maltooligosyltrehalose trehalohydrolase